MDPSPFKCRVLNDKIMQKRETQPAEVSLLTSLMG